MPIRPATAADVAAIVQLERQTATAAHWSEEQYRSLFGTSGEPSQRLTIVAEQAQAEGSVRDGKEKSAVQGFLVGRNLGTEWEIENLVVSEAVRRRGFGRRLVEELSARAHAAGAESVFLEVRESNQPARALYQSLGFAMTGRRKGYYASPAEDALLYRLGLS
ncbi:MAG: ribosomal protein S18-alanine N-acetyltransferase [Candidatus Sulfotelmatobacter sp.]